MTSPNQTARFGVLAADGIHIEGMPHPLTSRGGICRAPDLARCARTLGLTDLWLHPSLLPPHIRLCADWATPPDGSPWTVRANKGTADGALSHWYTAMQSGSYGVVNLCLMPQLPKGTPWLHAETGAALLSSLVAFRDALGTPWRRSAGATGTRLIREVHRGPHALMLDLPGEAPPPALDSTEVALSWRRPLTDDEKRRRYLHSFDKNGMYLGTCSSIALGFGQAAHVEGARDVAGVLDEYTTPEGKLRLPPGYWHVEADSWEIADADGLQPPLVGTARTARKRARKGERAVWMTTPTLTLLHEIAQSYPDFGYHVDAAYLWREHHRPLEPWYKRIREARAVLESGDARALTALKAVYSFTQGWLGSTRWDRSNDELYRPDWRHAIVAQARANLFRTWIKMHRAGVHPFAASTDCWYFVSDEPDPVKACPDALTLGTGLAHWKVKDRAVPLAEALPVIEGGHDLQAWLNNYAGRTETTEEGDEA